jgi:molecular chaperone GrpE
MREEQEETGSVSAGAGIHTEPDGAGYPEDETPAEEIEHAEAQSAREDDPTPALQRLRAENKALKERNLELLAEMSGYRQRLDREKDEFKKYAVSDFAGDMLAVADNICRALEAMPKELLGAIPALKSVAEGVEATGRILLNVLHRHQVTRFNPLGEPFNPHLHDAKAAVNIPDVPANTVVHVLCDGYMIGERVLRPAEVAVAQGGRTVERNAPLAENAPEEDDRVVPLFRQPGPDAPSAYAQAPRREEKPARKSSILQKSIITPSDGIPAATHPVWERLVTGQIKHRFKLFAANLLIDRARREFASNGGAKTRLASEICTFCNRYASLIADDLEPVVSQTGRIPPANHPVWESLVAGRIKHRFKLFAANLLIDRTKREYAGNRAAKEALAAELCKFFNEHADLTAREFETMALEETTWLN